MTLPGAGQGGAGFRSQTGLSWSYKFQTLGSYLLPGANGGALNQLLFTVPDGKLWEFVYLEYMLATTAAAGARQAGMIVADPSYTVYGGASTANIMQINGGYTQAPAVSVYYDFNSGAAPSVVTSGNTVYRVCPNRVAMEPGFGIYANVENRDAGDLVLYVKMCVREYSGTSKVAFL